MGPHIVHAYSITGLTMVLYVIVSVSFCFPQCVPVSVFMALMREDAFCLVVWMCELYVSFGSKVNPSILGFLVVGSGWLSIVSVSWVLNSAGSGVNRVAVVLAAFSVRLLFSAQVLIFCR